MKTYGPGERVLPVYVSEDEQKEREVHRYALKNKNGYVRRRWWGAIQFTSSIELATKWNDLNTAYLWARKNGLN